MNPFRPIYSDDFIAAEEAWAGHVPKTWKTSRIRNEAILSPGYSGEPPVVEEVCAMVPMEAVSESGAIDATGRELFTDIQAGLTLFEAGDVLFAKITPCMENGKGAFVAELPTRYAFGSTEFHVLRARRSCDPKFLYYATFNPIFRHYAAENMTGAAGQKRVSSRFLKDTRLYLPPKREQERIAAYLDGSCAVIDKAIAAKGSQIETLDALRKSAASQVLSRGLRLNAPQKDSGIESIGLIPSHWEVKQLRYACEVNYGITLQLEKGQSPGDGVRILTVSNITIDGNLDLEHEYYIDPADLKKDDYLRRGDLLFNWRNGSQYHVGKTAFFDLEGEFTHVSFLLRLRCGHKMTPFFLRSYLGVLKDSGFFSGAKDKVNKTFNSTELNRLRVVIPPLDEQKEICREIEDHAKKVNGVKSAIQTQIATLATYRKSLIHECVTGKRRVTDEDVGRVSSV
jgi:type I restriction enzyme, S subunit